MAINKIKNVVKRHAAQPKMFHVESFSLRMAAIVETVPGIARNNLQPREGNDLFETHCMRRWLWKRWKLCPDDPMENIQPKIILRLDDEAWDIVKNILTMVKNYFHNESAKETGIDTRLRFGNQAKRMKIRDEWRVYGSWEIRKGLIIQKE